jgi:hypothetical protein
MTSGRETAEDLRALIAKEEEMHCEEMGRY